MNRKISIIIIIIFCQTSLFGQGFNGFDKANLTPVTNSDGDWGLKIIVLNVGQADAILVIAPNGDVCLIDSGKWASAGNIIADYLLSNILNGVGELKTIDLVYSTHYDQDHIFGLHRVVERGIIIRKAFDQGLSKKREGKARYLSYVKAVGDTNNNYIQDDDEPDFVRHKIHYGHKEHIGIEDQVEILCVSVRGDTKGNSHDIDLDPSDKPVSFDENPGSIALIIRLGEFEFYTAGDQTDNDWKSKPATEEAVVNSGAIPGGNDIDVIKVNHHGSDTSTSKLLVTEMDPEVAIISTKYTRGDKLPKKIAIKMFQDNNSYVLITGDGINPDVQDYTDSGQTDEDNTNNFTVEAAAVFNNQGNVTILVSIDGSKYTVMGGSFDKTFSAKDDENVH